MADVIVVVDRDLFTPHPAGQFAAVCVDVINLGDKVESYPGSDTRIVPKLVLVFATGERQKDGELATVGSEFTISLHEKASLRRFLEGWQGKSFTRDELMEGIKVHDLEDKPALITIEHQNSRKGRVYAKIKGITPLPKGMARPDTEGYRRGPQWADRKKVYAAEVAKHEAEHQGAAPNADGIPF